MQHELFADDLRAALVGAPDVGSAVAAVVDAFTPALGDARGLEAAYADGGLKGLETRLTRDFLGSVASVRSHPRSSVLCGLHRPAQRHDAVQAPALGLPRCGAFVPGGTLAITRLSAASASGESRCLDDFVREIAGDAAPAMRRRGGAGESATVAPDADAAQARPRGDDVERILDYVWSLYVHARNQALRLHAGSVDAGSLERELIA